MVQDPTGEEEESENGPRIAAENKDDDGGNDFASHIPSPSAGSAMLSEAEQMCYKCNTAIADSSLRRAKRAIELERLVRRGGKTRRLLVKELLKIKKLKTITVYFI